LSAREIPGNFGRTQERRWSAKLIASQRTTYIPR
jgi:hypothetical protein